MPEDIKNSLGKLRLDTLPDTAIAHAARAFAFGMTKYPRTLSWRDGLPAGELRSAVLRHIMLWWNGQDRASDSGEKHLAHAIAGLMMIVDLDVRGELQDDRPAPTDIEGLLYDSVVDKMEKEYCAPKRLTEGCTVCGSTAVELDEEGKCFFCDCCDAIVTE